MRDDARTSRRRVVRGLGAATLVVLAGCGEPEDDDGATDDDPNENEQEDESDNRLGNPGGDRSRSR
jgi:hypothetical protein